MRDTPSNAPLAAHGMRTTLAAALLVVAGLAAAVAALAAGTATGYFVAGAGVALFGRAAFAAYCARRCRQTRACCLATPNSA